SAWPFCAACDTKPSSARESELLRASLAAPWPPAMPPPPPVAAGPPAAPVLPELVCATATPVPTKATSAARRTVRKVRLIVKSPVGCQRATVARRVPEWLRIAHQLRHFAGAAARR